ncbi:MAG: cytochrome c biogenesis protein ResB [Clostridiales bacterium]|nr:cytochrome c biogenesis protein ResB [Clostridiales bacterium]
MKKIRKIIGSMPFAIGVLVALAAACALSSLVTQGQTAEWYTQEYGERMGAVILALHADDAYHSWWFLTLTGFLCLSLILCNLIRVKTLIRRSKNEKGNRAGIWGAWVCHLGILLLVSGFALGQMTQEEYTIYGLPGQTKELGETGVRVQIEDFAIEWREDGSAGQYTAKLTAEDAQGKSESGTASVNHPASLLGYEFYQNSAGWAADLTVVKNGTEIQKETLCVGEFTPLADDPEIVILFRDFYPNYDAESGNASPMASTKPDKPGYLYMVFYQGEVRGMNVLETGDEITIDQEYTVTFSDPSNYTLLMVKRDRFTPLALLGAAVTMAGLVMAFYLRKR